jgi:hypothetical protein
LHREEVTEDVSCNRRQPLRKRIRSGSTAFCVSVRKKAESLLLMVRCGISVAIESQRLLVPEQFAVVRKSHVLRLEAVMDGLIRVVIAIS